MEEWKEYKLGNVCEVLNGRAYKQEELLSKGKYPVLRVGNIFQGNNWYYSDLELPENKYCNKGDLLYAWSCGFAPYIWEGDKTIYHYHIWKLIENKEILDRKFLYYYLIINTKRFVGGIHGSVMVHLTKKDMENQVLKVPSLSTQQKIANILSSLDDKIEVNRRINEQLEELAQALFKSWFVDFEPFKDGEFVESELGMIPEGWKVETLGELCDSISKKHSFKKDKLIFLNTGDIHNNIYLHDNYMLVKDMPGQAKKTIEKGDILYSEIRPVNRHFALVNFDSTDYVVSTKLMVIRSRNINNLRLFQYLTSKDVVDFLQQEAETRSGTFPQIRFENIQRLKMIIASNDVETKYASLLSSIYSRMENNNKEITHLANLRDTLLPKLMSGEIDVDQLNVIG